jgi:hypothetical protein
MAPSSNGGGNGCALWRWKGSHLLWRNHPSQVPVAGHRRSKAVPLADNCFNEPGLIGVVAQHHSKLSDSGVYAMINIEENVRTPKAARYLLARHQLPMSFDQQDEQLHRAFLEAHGAGAPLEEIARLVQCELAEMV